MGPNICLTQQGTITAEGNDPNTGLALMDQYDGSIDCCPENVNKHQVAVGSEWEDMNYY